MRRYIVVEKEYWDYIDFDECLESTFGDTIHNMYRCAVSFDNDNHPAFSFNITGDDIGLDEYTREEIFELIQTVQWNRQN